MQFEDSEERHWGIFRATEGELRRQRRFCGGIYSPWRTSLPLQAQLHWREAPNPSLFLDKPLYVALLARFEFPDRLR